MTRRQPRAHRVSVRVSGDVYVRRHGLEIKVGSLDIHELDREEIVWEVEQMLETRAVIVEFEGDSI